jgi:hypothetical protein
MPGHTLPIVNLVVRIAPLEGQTMFFVTCALAALTRAIENISFAMRETMKTGAVRRAHFRRRARRAAAEPAMSDSRCTGHERFLVSGRIGLWQVF